MSDSAERQRLPAEAGRRSSYEFARVKEQKSQSLTKMEGQPKEEVKSSSPGQSLVDEQKAAEIEAMMRGDLSYYMKSKPKVNISYVTPKTEAKVLIPSGSQEYQRTMFRNIASADHERFTGVTMISEEERKIYSGESQREQDDKMANLADLSKTLEVPNKKNRKAAKRAAGIREREVFTNPSVFEASFPPLEPKSQRTPKFGRNQEKILSAGETPEKETMKMEQSNQMSVPEGEQGQSLVNPQIKVEEVVNKFNTQECEQPEVESDNDEVDADYQDELIWMPPATIPMVAGVVETITKRFSNIGFTSHGVAVLKRRNGEACYSVSFSNPKKLPHNDDYQNVLAILSCLGLEDFTVYGLKQMYTEIPVTSTILHRWQVCLEKLSVNNNQREAQMAYQLIEESPITIAESYYLPPVEDKIVFEPETAQEENGEDQTEESLKVDAEPVKKVNRVTRMKALFRENPETIVNSSKGDITVRQWLEDFKTRHKINKQVKKAEIQQNKPENARQEAKEDGDEESIPETSSKPVETFKDDSIPKDKGRNLKEKTAHLLNTKKNPTKVVGQRSWEVNKGMRTTVEYSRKLSDGLVQSKQVITWCPDEVVPPKKSTKPKWAKCPIPGFPLKVWRRYPSYGKTETELRELAKRVFAIFVKAEVGYLRYRWANSRQKGINQWLSSAQNITAVFCDNPIEDWWLAYSAWRERAETFSSPSATPEQKRWAERQQSSSDNESN